MLSKADTKLLNRLRISQAQKVLLENYWSSSPETVYFSWGTKIAASLLKPAIIATFALPYFMSGIKPLMNIAVVLLWLLSFTAMAAGFGGAVSISLLANGNKDETMRRSLARFLPGGNSGLKRGYSILSWIALFTLTASDGYFATSAVVAVSGVVMWILGKISAGEVERFLEKRVKETTPLRTPRTIEGQIR